ncbi:CYTH and CHAD domain-containing protein [Arthrobacter sp. ISL-48]|uniref:CYTH and CHAD domain-containing protein n=1 Tax=Arthrobacter sp. ISL-48 TaxID=2819110 RepID=UPI001BE5DD0F|nr:CYTH and CHAD domain-containing protein [Arthrobacter sp. ISL-48]MBT2534241.1 CYTH and CHAD domain-containing protein [Arthrobacter sp. ISL-48]
MASQGIEIEKKYDVDEAAVVPSLADLPGVARVGEPHVATLEAVYFDSDRHTLASRHITLRRRTGGADAGWHLKLPAGTSDGSDSPAGQDSAAPQRREVHAPLGQPAVVPDRLLAHVQAYLRGAGLAPVVRLETRRTTYPLYAEDGVHLADLADDRVQSQALTGDAQSGGGLSGDGQTQQWREWELELVHGSPDLFPAAEDALAAAGASPARHGSKLARALGEAADTREPDDGEPSTAAPGKKSPASAVVTAYLAAQIREILAHDPGVRLEEPDAVHTMRSAVRRTRSALSAYRSLYSAVAVRRLRDELTWLGRILGAPRDAEVIMERLRRHMDELPEGPAVALVKSSVEHELGGRFDSGYRKMQEVLLSERYFRLLDDLEEFRDSPPVRPEGTASGRKMAAKLVEKAAKRLRRSHQAAKGARRGAQHETALHQVRKDAKRLRHVAESASPVHGKRAAKIAKAARRQQKILGELHDSVLALELLGRLGAGPDLPEAVASVYVTLRMRQAQLAAEAESTYRKAWKKSRKLLQRGVL